MDLTLITTRLRSTLTGFKAIGGAADLDAAIEGAVATPSAFVIPLAESAKPGGLLGVHDQCIAVAFGVVLVVANLRDARGDAAMQDLTPLRMQVRQALAGWTPVPADGEPVQMAGGRLLRLAESRLWWSDEFTVETYFRSEL